MDAIPIIDLSTFLAGGAGGRPVVDRVADACRGIGFFLITGHGVPAAVIDDLDRAALDFFDLPEMEKRRRTEGRQQQGGLGFAPLFSESLAATAGDGAPVPGDVKESLNFGPLLPGGSWPDGLHAAFAACFAAMEQLAESLRRLFCAAIGLDPGYFEADFTGHLSALRVINYPEPAAQPLPGQLRAGAHTDYGFLTILRAQASAGGLQVRTPGGAWLDAPDVAGAFVVNLGDALMRWTNGVWRSTPHRVVNPPAARRAGSRRQSIAFFHNPNDHAILHCLAAFGPPERPAAYPPIRYGDYIALKTRQAFPEKAPSDAP